MKVLIIGNRSHQFIYNYVKTLKKVYLNSDLEIDILSQDSSDLFSLLNPWIGIPINFIIIFML